MRGAETMHVNSAVLSDSTTLPPQITPRARRASLAEPHPGWSSALIAGAIYTAITLVLLIAAFRAAGHHFVYPLDDTYIGMAMAKNLALHGVWGVTPFAFSSSSSSLLFPLLLAAIFRVLGPNQAAPLLLSWFFGLASVFAADTMLSPFLNRNGRTIALTLMVLFAPLFVLGVLGMEHSLHLLLTLLFLQYFLRFSTGDPEPEPLARIGLIAALMVAARYEGLFFVAPACCFLLLSKRWKAAFAIGLSAMIPVCIYAAVSLAHGAAWLPNSVALKGVSVHRSAVLGALHDALLRTAINAWGAPHLVLLLAGIALLLVPLLRVAPRRALPLLLIECAGCLHLATARVGWVYRYEDYLIASAVVTLACAFPFVVQLDRRRLLVAACFLLTCAGVALLRRAVLAAYSLPLHSRGIYSQQWQMARFLHAFYPHATVAANDIGAIDYFNDIHCYDLVGLANQDVFNARRAGRYTTDFLRASAAAHGVRIAIVYDRWFAVTPGDLLGGPPLPSGWIRIARWSVLDRSVVAEPTISFYAVDPAQAAPLRSALLRFDPTLPRNVQASLP